VSWVKLDDQFFSHPKAREAGPNACLLYLAGLTYCARHLTDGKIPKSAVTVIAAEAWSKASNARVLCDVGFWHDEGDHYDVHGYLEFNPSREQVEKVRRDSRERRANAGRRSGKIRASDTNPDPTPPDVPTEHSGARKRAVSPPSDFEPTDAHRAYAAEHGLNLPGEVERWLTDCEAKGRTYKSINAGFTTWLHHAVDFGRGGKPVATLEQLAEPAPLRVLDDQRKPCPLGACDGSGFVDVAGGARACRCRSVRSA
jgi:hypothetical protein